MKSMYSLYKIKYNNLTCLVLSMLLQIVPGCKKLVEIPPPATLIASDNVFTNDETAIATLTGLYVEMSAPNAFGFTGNNGLSVIAGLSSDEFSTLVTGSPAFYYYTNSLGANGSSVGSEYWEALYKYVFKCNSIIEGLTEKRAEALTPAVRQQLLGEAKFMRGFYYFYLVNLFGELPLVLTTDYKVNTLLARTSVNKIYEQIIADLKEASTLLSSTYLAPGLLSASEHRVRPTNWAANALLARAYLYNEQYSNAEDQSSLIIDHASLFSLTSIDSVFLKNNTEAIWQIQPTTVNFNTEDALTFILPPSGPDGLTWPVSLSSELLAAFEPGDLRRVGKKWVDSVTVDDGTTYYFPFKYKNNTLNPDITGATGFELLEEYQTMLRLAEQYLIRAEARARQNNLTGAIGDLDKIRERAQLPLVASTNPGISQDDLINAILDERFVELFSEYGHRWFDLKRTGKVDEVMTVVTPLKSLSQTQWQSYQQLYPIPQNELNNAPNLVQNPGYGQ
ncbi:MAG: RagB/SusD family nutrient uptake outer membrane protein [Chitinophagaceae bacterium]|nr:RagB/SusD family nutrient uptake outer membrane protein [Chitinophagaceae bacterium]